MRVHRLVPIRRLPCGFGGRLCVAVGVIEHAQAEQLRQCARDGPVDRFIRQDELLFRKALRHRVRVVVAVLAALVGLEPRVVVKQAADQVDAAVRDRKADALRHVEHFHAPVHVVEDAGVGIDIARKAHLLAQQPIDQRLIKGKTVRQEIERLAVFVLLRGALFLGRLRVVRHNRRRAAVNRHLEGRQMVFLQAAFGLVDVPLAHLIVRVKAVFARAAAREMLDGHRDAVFCHAVRTALDARDQVAENVADERCVLAKGAERALPARVRHRVGHVHVALAQARGVPAVADAVGKFVGDMEAVALDGCRNPQRSRPRRKYAGRVVHAVNDLTVFVSGIRHHFHRDKMRAFLGDLLQLV